MISEFHIKIDFQLPGNLTGNSIILDTVQLPLVKNHLFLDIYIYNLFFTQTLVTLKGFCGHFCLAQEHKTITV